MYPSKKLKVGHPMIGLPSKYLSNGVSLAGRWMAPTNFAGWEVSTLCFCMLSRKLFGSNRFESGQHD